MIKIKVHDAAYPFGVVGLVEDYKSLIWTERYNDVGDFELHVRMTIENYELLSLDRILSIPDTTKRMIIESHEIKESEEDGETSLILKGRSLECILDRRIVLETMYVYGKLDDVLNEIITDNIISTAYSPRNIPNFTYQAATGMYIDNKIFSSESVTFYGEEILDIVLDYCQRADVGFELELDSSDDFVFHLYNGVSRTIYQTENPPLMFSKAFDNLKATSFFETKEHYKTDTLVIGQIATEAGTFPPDWLVLEVEDDYIPGLEKRETMTDASDLNRYTPSEELIPLTTYSGKYMQARGKRDLLNNKKIYQYFEATVELNGLVYRTDYDLGDLISYRDSFGNVGTALIQELIISDDTASGKQVYPILSTRPSDHYSHIEPVVEALLVGGGGGGGGNQRGGGGGAGEVHRAFIALEHATEYDIVVGAGGAGNSGASGSDGGWSQFGSEFADGGGGGGYGSAGAAGDGHPGYNACGGGGGGSTSSTDGAGGSGKHYGGGGSNGPTNYGGGGGGGDSEDGYGGYSGIGANTSKGGAGTAHTITGSSVTYGGGGGGYGSTYVGAGGVGGGGNANNSGTGGAGTNGLGGGGGAGLTTGGAGGSGVVIVRLMTALYSGTYTGSPTITTDGDYTILKFTANGSYTS